MQIINLNLARITMPRTMYFEVTHQYFYKAVFNFQFRSLKCIFNVLYTSLQRQPVVSGEAILGVRRAVLYNIRIECQALRMERLPLKMVIFG